MNVRAFKRRLHQYSEHTVREIVKHEIEGPYIVECMWNKLRTSYNVVDPREMVMRKTRKLQRRSYVSPGPNATCHVDGYLKPYGLPIHGCL